jgi:hypothetical protein
MKCPNPSCAIDGMLQYLVGCGQNCDGVSCVEAYLCKGCGSTWDFKSWLVGNEVHNLVIPNDYKGNGQ